MQLYKKILNSHCTGNTAYPTTYEQSLHICKKFLLLCFYFLSN